MAIYQYLSGILPEVGKAAQNAMPRVYCVRINAVSPPMHQTDGREDK